ncbi:unnamed protein product [Rotaria sp. Silwood1]|nr:unnamed protein product [Rotaria sp. Silwood1]CAF4935969.1 unnamed protein product [Rotaria sp. Silwood1]
MGGRFGKKKKDPLDPSFPPPNDPFYQYAAPLPPPGGYGRPPPYPYPPGYGPGAGFGEDPYDIYGYGPRYLPTESFEPTLMGGPLSRGQSPWNYGNLYMGNTTLQMIPLMQRKLAKFAQLQGMLGMGNGSMPMMPCLPASCCMPCLPASCSMPCLPASCSMPCLPASCCMPMASPMIAAASPLPAACNPLVQCMYPMSSTNCCNWMTPSSFMSALSTGPTAFRPPSLDFPCNVGMVMTYPCGTPNPLLAPPSFGGFCPQYNARGGMSCCCCYCTPSVPPPPAISYYPRPVCVPQPYPVPCPAPVPIPNVQQVPVPRCVPNIAPPIIADCNSCGPVPAGAPLLPSGGVLNQCGISPSLVMGSSRISSKQTLFNDDETNENLKSRTSIRKSFDESRRKKAERIAASLSKLGLDNTSPRHSNSNRKKYRRKSTRHIHNRTNKDFSLVSKSNDDDMSDSDLTTLDTLFSLSRKKQFSKSERHSRSNYHKSLSICD